MSESVSRHMRAAIRRTAELHRAMQAAEARAPWIEDDRDWRDAVQCATDLSNRLVTVAEKMEARPHA